MSEMFLDKTLVSIVLFPWLQWIFLKAVASVKKQVASFAGISSHAITEGFYLVFCLQLGGVDFPHCSPGIVSDCRVTSGVGILFPITNLYYVANSVECQKDTVSLLVWRRHLCTEKSTSKQI